MNTEVEALANTEAEVVIEAGEIAAVSRLQPEVEALVIEEQSTG